MQARPRRRRHAVILSGALALAIGLAGCSIQSPVDVELPPQTEVALPEATVTQLQDAVSNAMAATGSSGAIVGVWAPWSGSWISGVGVQHADTGGEVSADMQFKIGRVTRAMTCDILYGAAADGYVDLDDSVASLVGGLARMTEVSLEQLCDSTSGIGSYAGQLMPLWLSNPERVWNPRLLAGYGFGPAPAAAPGTAYIDSDAGYVALGLALERATGRTAAQLVQDYVAGPLGLEQTGLGDPSSEAVLAGGQSLPGEGGALSCAAPLDLTALSSSAGFTDSGAYSDIADLGRYGQALATGALVDDDAERFADARAPYADAPSWHTVGGGAVLAGSLIGQYGAIPGYLTSVFSDPASGLTVALVLNNSAGGGDFAAWLAWELAAIASKAPAAQGETAPQAGLPWTAEQFHTQIAQSAVCPLPAG